MAKQTSDKITAEKIDVIKNDVDATKIEVNNGENSQVQSANDSKTVKLPKMPLPMDKMEFIGGLTKAFVDNDASKFGGHFLPVEKMRRVEFFGDKIYSFVENCGVWGLIVNSDGKTRATTAIISYDGKNVAITMPHNTGKKPIVEFVAAKFQGEDTFGYNPSYLRKISSYINDEKALVAIISFNHFVDNNFSFPAAFYTRADMSLLKREYPAILKYFETGIDTKADIKIDYREVKLYFDYRAKLKDIILDGDKSDNQKTAAKELLAKIA